MSSISDIVNLIVSYLPTILFFVIIGLGILFGVVRGFRKSLILGIQAACSFVLCLILYLIFVNTSLGETLIINIANMILGDNGLQSLLGVSSDAQTLSDILIEYLPKVINYGEGVSNVIEENGAYIATLVNLVFHLIYAIVFSMLHCDLVFTLYIVYLIAYSERKYKRKHKGTYKKRRLLGLAVGTSRALVASVLVLSFLGSGLYTITGGKGEGKMVEHTFDDPMYQEAYDAYRSLDRYGTTGIFKVLNTFSNDEGTPYYLFAADLVFSGGLKDENINVDENISFRDEISAYTGFSKDTLNLMLKYGGDEVDKLLTNSEEVSMDAVLEILSKPEFQEEFDELILNFDSKTYFVNLTFSLITSIINHIDELSLTDNLSADTVELIKLLFANNYLSDYIPEEKALKDIGETADTTACLKVSHLLEKNDVLVVYKMLISILQTGGMEQEVITASTETEIRTEPTQEMNLDASLNMVKKALPYIKQLSILQDSRKSEIEPVLSRLYCYIENKHLTPVGFEPITLTEIVDADIHWIDEINSLIDLADDAVDMYLNIYQPNKEMLDILVSIFDKSNENYEENIKCYEEVCDLIASSKMLGKIVSSNAITNKLISEIKNLNAYTYIKEDINFENVYDADGKVKEYGELYYIFNGIKLIGQKGDAELINSLIPQEGEEFDFSSVKQLAEIITEEDEEGNSVADYLLNSNLFHSVISAYIVEQSNSEGMSLYVPSSALEKDQNGDVVNLVNKDELSELLDCLPSLIDSISPLMDGDVSMDDLKNITSSDAIGTLLDSNNSIMEGTLSKALYDVLSGNSMVIIPSHLQDVDSWFVNQEYGELDKIIAFVKDSNVSVFDIIESDNQLSTITQLNDKSIDLMLNSEVLHYTISNVLLNNSDLGEFKIIIPDVCRDELNDDLIYKDEIKTLFDGISTLGIDGTEISSSKLLVNVAQNKDELLSSLIIKTTIINFISNNESIATMLDTPKEYKDSGAEESLLKYDANKNVWEEEIYDLIDCLNELFDLSNKDDSFVLDEETMNNELSTIFADLNEKVNNDQTLLDLCYNSEIVLNKLTIEMDNVLEDQLIPSDELVNVKDNEKGYYTYAELEAFVDSINIFGIGDILNASQDDLQNAITSSVLTLNETLEDEKYNQQRKIDVIYNSYIIKYIFSDKLDASLDGMIDETVLSQIKEDKKIYEKDELVLLVDAINELEIDSLTEISNFDLSTISSFNDTSIKDTSKTKLNVIYSSRIIGGVITKTISDITKGEDAVLVDHPLAYQEDIDIYNESEISTLIDILGDIEDMDSFDISNIDLSKVEEAIYDETNKTTSSYLLVATLSKEISSYDNVIVPTNVIESEQDASIVIVPQELYKMIHFVNNSNVDLFDIIESDNQLSTITQLNDDSVNLMLNSEILYYTISNILLDNNSNLGEVNIIIPYDCRIELTDDVIDYLINKDEIKDLFNGISTLGIDETEISSSKLLVNVAQNKDELLSSLIIKTTIINFISNNESIATMLDTPYDYILYGKEEYLLEFKYDETDNVWEEEIYDLIDCLNELFDLSNKDDSFVLDEETMNNELSTIFADLNEKVNNDQTLLDLCYNSEIILNKLTIEMDNVLEDQLIPRDELVNNAKDNEKGYYTYAELEAFVDSINIFGIGDILNASSEELQDSITSSVFTLNETLEDEKYNQQRKIDVIYNSYIIKYIFSDKLDASLDGMIDETVLSQIKDGKKIYEKDELVSLVDAINELEIKSLTELSNFDFTKVSSFNDTSIKDTSKTKLNVIYSSRIIGGVITKTISDITKGEDAFLVDHPLAYQEDIDIYNESEVSTLIDILGGVDIDEFNISNLNINNVKAAIYDETNETTSSYLLVATLSKEMSSENGVVVPKDVIDQAVTTSQIIVPYELKELLDAFETLLGSDLSSWEINANIDLPEGDDRKEVSKSMIARASITKMVAEANVEDEELEVLVNTENCLKTQDINSQDIIVVNQEEMVDMFNALEIFDDVNGQTFTIPRFTLVSIMQYKDNIEVLYKCDVVKYRICDVLLDSFNPSYVSSMFTTTHPENSYNLNTAEEAEKQVIEYLEIKAFCDNYPL